MNMRRKVFYVLAMVAIVAVASVNVLNLRTSASTGNLYLANLMALSDGNEGGGGETEWGCGGNPTYRKNMSLQSKVCLNGGTHLVCKKDVGVCCDPSKQTDCDGILSFESLPNDGGDDWEF